MRPAPAANIASRTASAFSAGTKTTHLSRSGPTEIGARTSSTVRPSASASASDTPGDAESALVCAVNNARPVRIIWCTQRALGRARGDGVDAAQQQRMMREQQAPVGHLGDDGGGRVDGDRHRLDRLRRVAADQPHRIPVLRQARRIGRLEHIDDVGQQLRSPQHLGHRVDKHRPLRPHRRAQELAHPGRRTCRSDARQCPCRPGVFASARHPATANRTNGAHPSTTSTPMLVMPATISRTQLSQAPRGALGLGHRFR